MKIQTLQPRPVSIVITQILMLINFVPITLGLGYAFVRAILTHPAGLISVRAVLFLVISSVLMIIFLGYGFGGLWKRKRSGYWVGLLFLGIAIAITLYRVVALLYQVLSLGHRSQSLIAFSLVARSLMFLFVSALFLKLLLGKKEKLFFNPPDEDNKTTRFEPSFDSDART